MECTAHADVLLVSFSRSDVGSWDAVRQVLGRDASGNAVPGRVELEETSTSFVRSEGLEFVIA